jgi:hypothetical protein
MIALSFSIFAMIGVFYLIPMLFLWLALRRSYQTGSMTREDVVGLFPFTFLPLINFFVFIWIIKEVLLDLHLYNRLINLIIGEKK